MNFILLAIICIGPDCYSFPQQQFETEKQCFKEMKTYHLEGDVKLYCLPRKS